MGAMIVATGSIAVSLLQRIDLRVGLAQDPQPIAHRMHGGFRGGQIRLRLLPVLQAPALGIVERMLAGLVDARELELRDRRGEIVLRLHEFGGLHGGQRRALLHGVAQTGDHARSPGPSKANTAAWCDRR